jgi:hypothetical protein
MAKKSRQQLVAEIGNLLRDSGGGWTAGSITGEKLGTLMQDILFNDEEIITVDGYDYRKKTKIFRGYNTSTNFTAEWTFGTSAEVLPETNILSIDGRVQLMDGKTYNIASTMFGGMTTSVHVTREEKVLLFECVFSSNPSGVLTAGYDILLEVVYLERT